MDKTKIKLLHFLKENGAYENYIFNFKNLNNYHISNDFKNFDESIGEDLICASFAWSDTKEGRDFWCDLSNKWFNYIRKNMHE